MGDIDENLTDETKEGKGGITRRDFLAGAAAGAAVVGVGASVLGVPSALAAGSPWSDKDAANVVWDMETDILVLGTGYAAFTAATPSRPMTPACTTS